MISKKPLALACAIAVSLPFAARADEPAPSTVVITGSRFPSAASLEPIGATVITSDEIRQAGVNDVNQAIRKIGGARAWTPHRTSRSTCAASAPTARRTW
jgi:iron complex outermembrane receptor protein